MSMFELKYRAGEFAEMIGVSTDTLRDWRRRHIDVGLAPSINGQKQYCDYDRLEMRVFDQLRIEMFNSISEAFEAARHVTPLVAVRLGLSLSGHPDAWSLKFYAETKARYGLISGKDDFAYTNNLEHFMERDAMADYMRPAFIVIIIDDLADRVSGWVAENLPGELK